MTVRAVALKTGETQQDYRLNLAGWLTPGATSMQSRSGVYYYGSSVADITTVSPMVASVAPFRAVVQGTSNALQGPYLVAVDTAEQVTFESGEGAVARTDQVVLQLEDNPWDVSGQTRGRVVIVKGQSSGAASALPPSTLRLWDVLVPAGASVGGGGFTLASVRTDQRRYLPTFGQDIPVINQADRDTLPLVNGLRVLRLDNGNREEYAGGFGWFVRGGSILDNVISPPRACIRRTTNQAAVTSTYTPVDFTATRYAVGGSWWSGGTPRRLIIPVSGVYSVGASLEFAANASGDRLIGIAKNAESGSDHIVRQVGKPTGFPTRLECSRDYPFVAGDYIALIAYQSSGGNLDLVGSAALDYTIEMWAHRIGA
ncbi:MAG: hypothetical protein ACRDT8_00265 [Micromonosporaceae bacterium]